MNSHIPRQHTPPNGTLYFFWIGAIVTVILIAFSSRLMALGAGLASSETDPVSPTSLMLWGISGSSFVPVAILLIVVTASRKRTWGVALG